MSGHAPAPILAGALSGFALADVLQLLELGSRSGTLVVDGGPLGGGSVWLRAGRVVRVALERVGENAASEDHAAAVSTLLDIPAGRWAFYACDETVAGPGSADVGVRISAILVEAARRGDERTRAAAPRVPDAGDVPLIASTPSGDAELPVESRLTAADLHVLAAIDGVRDVSAIATVVARDPTRVQHTISILRALGVVRPFAPCERGTAAA